jgi:gamma-glutamyltranspeptidase / glutathione hydrolase
MTLDDLKNYKVMTRDVANISYRGADLHGIGSPAGGAVCLSILKIMEQYDMEDWTADRNLSFHRFDEAMRFAYSARLGLGDPDFVQDMPSLETRMMSDAMAEEIHSRIMDNQTQPIEAYDPSRTYLRDSHGTSHISTADGSGMATSLTTTVNLLFGAQIIDPVSGVIMYVCPSSPPFFLVYRHDSPDFELTTVVPIQETTR